MNRSALHVFRYHLTATRAVNGVKVLVSYLLSRMMRRYHFHDGHIYIKGTLKNDCRWLWFCPVINWDGSVVPCCFDKDNDFLRGALGDGTPGSQIWRNKTYSHLRRKILSSRQHIDMCSNCSEGLKNMYLKHVNIQ